MIATELILAFGAVLAVAAKWSTQDRHVAALLRVERRRGGLKGDSGSCCYKTRAQDKGPRWHRTPRRQPEIDICQ
ncbi:hypothetical protein OH76DRAFT_608708 [Lentinus brumalis]|uniref:Secreted protein n=1 Tax=Lentinus brumalis TaxID=2498619 RepID=A0A371DUS3_9APHY|nr:hypothetical protein OH76DRAFT_608708 [Polyporus brumalis]